MRKVWFGAALALLITVLEVGPAGATRVPVLSGTATSTGLSHTELFTNGCTIYIVIDGTFTGQFIAGPAATRSETGSVHVVACGDFAPIGIVDTGIFTLTTGIGTLTGTEVALTNFDGSVGLTTATWTITGGTGAYNKVKGTITINQVVSTTTVPLQFASSSTMSFDLTR